MSGLISVWMLLLFFLTIGFATQLPAGQAHYGAVRLDGVAVSTANR